MHTVKSQFTSQEEQSSLRKLAVSKDLESGQHFIISYCLMSYLTVGSGLVLCLQRGIHK